MSDELTTLKSELRERTDLLFSYALQAKGLETQLVEVKAQLAAAQAEITRLRAGGCAREQGTTQYCGEMQAMVVKLTALTKKWRKENCYDKGRRETLDWCADRLREAISGKVR